MLLHWWRRRAEQRKRQHLPSRRRRLAFERLEERCLLSARTNPVGAAWLLLADPSGKDGPPVSVMANTDRLGTAVSDVYVGNEFGGASQIELLQPSSLAANDHNLPDDDHSQLALTPDNGDRPRDGPNALKPMPSEHGLAGNDNSHNGPPQPINSLLPGSDNTEHPLDDLFPLTSGRQVTMPLLVAGDIHTSHVGRGPHDPITTSANFQSDRIDVGNKPADARDLGVSTGTFLSQGNTIGVQGFHRDERAASEPPVVLANPLWDSSDANLELGRAAFVKETDPVGSSEMLSRWPSGSWIEQIREARVGAVGYAEAGTVQRGLHSLPNLSVAVERLVSASASFAGTDRAQQRPAHPASVGREAHSALREMLAGQETRLVETPTNGTVTLTGRLPISEIITDTGTSPSAELIHRHETLPSGVTALTSEAARLQDLTSGGAGLSRGLMNSPASSAPGDPVQSDILLSSQAFASTDCFGLLQCNVAMAGPKAGDAVMAGSTGTTSVYLTNDESSIWTILTTYALVIVPRQRKPQATIMVVDPDDATRDALSIVLVRAGYFVLPAASVRDAWGMLRTPNARIDLVLMDPHLPDVSGIHLCARLREMSPTLPVMVCAGEVEPAEVAQLQQLGVRYYLRKPIAFEELLHTVKAILL